VSTTSVKTGSVERFHQRTLLTGEDLVGIDYSIQKSQSYGRYITTTIIYRSLEHFQGGVLLDSHQRFVPAIVIRSSVADQLQFG